MSQHHHVIKILAQNIGTKTYLELGLYKSELILDMAKLGIRCTGVDVKDVPRGNFTFVQAYTHDFFRTNVQTFDMIFIDADHKFESARDDLVEALKILNSGGVIIMHDTDPAELKLISPGYCGDSYKIIKWIDEYNDTLTDKLTAITLPVDTAGLTLIRRQSDSRVQKILTK